MNQGFVDCALGYYYNSQTCVEEVWHHYAFWIGGISAVIVAGVLIFLLRFVWMSDAQ